MPRPHRHPGVEGSTAATDGATRSDSIRGRAPQVRARSIAWRIRAFGAGAVALAATSGCLLPRGQRMEDMRQRLIGLPARELNRCVGIPADTHTEGDTEYLTYRFEYEAPERDPFEREDVSDPRSRFPELEDTRFPGDPRRPGGAADSVDPGPRGPRLLRTGYCELVFEVRDGQVSHVEVDSRLPSGLRNDIECLRTTRDCTDAR